MEQKRFDFLNLERRSTFPQNSHFSSSPFGPGGSGTSKRSDACFFSVTGTKTCHNVTSTTQNIMPKSKDSALLIRSQPMPNQTNSLHNILPCHKDASCA